MCLLVLEPEKKENLFCFWFCMKAFSFVSGVPQQPKNWSAFHQVITTLAQFLPEKNSSFIACVLLKPRNSCG